LKGEGFDEDQAGRPRRSGYSCRFLSGKPKAAWPANQRPSQPWELERFSFNLPPWIRGKYQWLSSNPPGPSRRGCRLNKGGRLIPPL